MAEQGRFQSVDGLRGLAAFVVVVYHCVLVIPAMSVPTDGSQAQAAGSSAPWSLIWWLYRTPLRVLWAGPEAVLIFFVISGFVLTLPLAGMAHWSWPAYYARRLCRLYLPVWGALVGAVILGLLVKRNDGTGSVWMRGHQPPTVSALLHDVTLVLGTSTVDGPLWSLRWEIWFSLGLPIGFLVLRRLRTARWWPWAIVLMAALSALATTNPLLRSLSPGAYLFAGLLQYMPVFGIGMIMALNVGQVQALADRLCAGRRPGARTAALGVLAAAMLVSPSYLPTAVAFGPALLSLLGVVLVLLLSLRASPFVRFLRSPTMRWAGSRSFSIYLIHEPVIVAVALLTKAGPAWPWAGIALVALPVVLLLAEGFYRLVEHPAHRLSARVGRLVDDRRSDRTVNLTP